MSSERSGLSRHGDLLTQCKERKIVDALKASTREKVAEESKAENRKRRQDDHPPVKIQITAMSQQCHPSSQRRTRSFQTSNTYDPRKKEDTKNVTETFVGNPFFISRGKKDCDEERERSRMMCSGI